MAIKQFCVRCGQRLDARFAVCTCVAANAVPRGRTEIRRRAWTGGERPGKLMATGAAERALRSAYFRAAMGVRGAFWGGNTLEDARVCYVGAKYDAFETVRWGGQ